MVQIVACYHPDLSRCDDVMDLQGGRQSGPGLRGEHRQGQKGVWESRTAYQTDVGVNAHLDVLPVKLNAPGSNPEGDAAEEGKGRDSPAPKHPQHSESEPPLP